MANKVWDFSTPGEYTYDSNKIEVSGGLAIIKEDLTNVHARWHLNESSGDNVPDDSGNVRNGTRINMEDGDWIAGKLNNCLQFDGVNEYVNCGSIASFERTDEFSLEAWFATSSMSGTILSKRDGAPTYRGWVINLINGQIRFDLINNNATSNKLSVRTTNTFNDGSWHHVIVTYDGTSLVSGIHIWVDGTDRVLTSITDALSATIVNSVDCNIASYDNGFVNWNGKLDEVVIYDKELTSDEVAYRYNLGSGRENFIYYSDKPIIEPTNLFDPATVSFWDSFLEILGGDNHGVVGYNLYKVDKTNKYYWNGSAWVTGGSVSNYNSITVINANISSFDASPDKIGYIAYLISDGEQRVELDENQLTYSTNIPPFVNAGSNKSCKDDTCIAPFSDCSFSDPDGTIVKGEYKVDGEVDIWTEIPQGAYGTLLEAVQAFVYCFTNSGALTVRLQVTDNESETSKDSLIVTVEQYAVTFNIMDIDDNDLSNVYCDFDDGLGWQWKNSPFIYYFDYRVGGYDCSFDKAGYSASSVNVISTDHVENFHLDKIAVKIIYPLILDLTNIKKTIDLTPIKKTIAVDVKCMHG